ncbi:hypothetical protein QBC44DRAFT_332007 [Cladorrhinum sp. PSN332]|nr:hypothetical protein QBC44DRAFT_332007 [Cladorrhinum sp. PSN332]
MQPSPTYKATPLPYPDEKNITRPKEEVVPNTARRPLLFHAKCTLFYLWVTALVTLIVLLAKQGSVSLPHTACKPDRTFSPYKENFSRWSRATFFEVTLAAGTFSFTQAKLIDIAWDILIGRAGQAALAYFSWRAFSDYAAIITMQTRPINYSMFRTIFIFQDASISSVWCLIRNTWSSNMRGGKQATASSAGTLCFVITSLAFTVSFPTFASAITGYVAAVDSYVVGYENLAIKFSEFDFVAYVIRDGSRIKLPDDYLVAYHLPERDVPVGGRLERGEPLLMPEGSEENPAPTRCRMFQPGCELASNVSEYVSLYGFHGLQHDWTWWFGSGVSESSKQMLGVPVLNISAYYLFPPREEPVPYDLRGFNWTDPENPGERPFQNRSKTAFMTRFDHQTLYDLEYIKTHGICQQAPNVYQWGFSFAPLFMITVALLLWTIGVALMYCKVSFCLPLAVGYPEVPRGSRCILHYADAMRDQLCSEKVDPGSLTDKELTKLIETRMEGGSVSWEEPLSLNCVGLGRGIRTWLARESWRWPALFLFQALTFVISLTVWGLTGSSVTVVVVSWLGSLAVYLVMVTGQSRGKGLLLFVCVCMIPLISATLALAWAVIK